MFFDKNTPILSTLSLETASNITKFSVGKMLVGKPSHYNLIVRSSGLVEHSKVKYDPLRC